MSLEHDFETFWRHYPRRIGKLAAQKAYAKARKLATAEELLAGIERYRAAKPAYADYCHASTYLNQGRWMDEADPEDVYRPWDCPHTPTCAHRGACANLLLLKKTS